MALRVWVLSVAVGLLTHHSPRSGCTLRQNAELLALIAAQQEELRVITEDRELLNSANGRIKQQVAALKSEMFEAFSLLQKDLYEEQQRSQDLQAQNEQLFREIEKQLPTLAIVESMIRLAKAVREENKALVQMLDEVCSGAGGVFFFVCFFFGWRVGSGLNVLCNEGLTWIYALVGLVA